MLNPTESRSLITEWSALGVLICFWSIKAEKVALLTYLKLTLFEVDDSRLQEVAS